MKKKRRSHAGRQTDAYLLARVMRRGSGEKLSFPGSGISSCATRCNRGNDTRARAHDRPAFDNPRHVCAQRPRRAVKTIRVHFFVARMAQHKASQLRKSAARRSAAQLSSPKQNACGLKILKLEICRTRISHAGMARY